MRTFLAVELPETILESIQAIVVPLQGALPAQSVRWVPVENMHVTIKFLGETDPSDLSRVNGGIRSCCRQNSPFSMEIGGLGAFPSQRRPNVLWIGAGESDHAVKALHACIEESLEPLGFRRESRELHLHVTWGRVRRGTRASVLRVLSEALSQLEVGNLGWIQVDHLILFESHLRPTGAEYRAVEQFPLGPG